MPRSETSGPLKCLRHSGESIPRSVAGIRTTLDLATPRPPLAIMQRTPARRGLAMHDSFVFVLRTYIAIAAQVSHLSVRDRTSPLIGDKGAYSNEHKRHLDGETK